MKQFVSISIFVLGLFLNSAHAIQMILATSDPFCVQVEPKRLGGVVDIHYTISGVKEKQVDFYVRQLKNPVHTIAVIGYSR